MFVVARVRDADTLNGMKQTSVGARSRVSTSPGEWPARCCFSRRPELSGLSGNYDGALRVRKDGKLRSRRDNGGKSLLGCADSEREDAQCRRLTLTVLTLTFVVKRSGQALVEDARTALSGTMAQVVACVPGSAPVKSWRGDCQLSTLPLTTRIPFSLQFTGRGLDRMPSR